MCVCMFIYIYIYIYIYILASVKTEGSIAASRGDKRLTTGAIPVHCACEFKQILPAL